MQSVETLANAFESVKRWQLQTPIHWQAREHELKRIVKLLELGNEKQTS